MLKVRKENFEALLDYGFKDNMGVYSYEIDEYFTLFVNLYINNKGLIKDGVVRIGYTNENIGLDSSINIIDDSIELPNVLYDLIMARIVYVG